MQESSEKNQVCQSLRKADTMTYQQILDLDTFHAIPDSLRLDSPGDLPLKPIPASRYTSQAFADLEAEKVFLKTWQFACREEDIPETGDTHVHDLVGKSLLLTRQADGSIKALRNVCRHRGRRLVTQGGNHASFRCPYHAFTWNVDGTFRSCPLPWDFPQIGTHDLSLNEARVESWAGFVFVNFDAEATPLLEALAPIPEHFARWNIADCYKAAHVGKVLNCNWKIATEAFLENFHVATTHPQMTTYIGDANTQYDVLSDHVDRMLGPIGFASTQVDLSHMSEDEVFKAMISTGSRAGTSGKDTGLPGEMTAREQGAEMARQRLQQEHGYDYSHACDAEVLDGISYQFFPNFAIWGGMSAKTCYRWRPIGRRPDQCLMEVMLYKRHPKGGRGASVPLRLLGEDELWSSASELGYLSGVYDQDVANFGPLQEGLNDLGDEPVHFGRYTELRCRHLHQMLDQYMAR